MKAANRTNSDTDPQPGAHPGLAATTVAFALSRGLTMAQISEATDIGGHDLAVCNTRLPEEVLPRIWRLIGQEVTSTAPLTMDMAKAAPFSFFADIAHGAQFAETVGEAASLLITHRRVLSDLVEAEMTYDGDEVILSSAHPFDYLDEGRSSEMSNALVWRLLTHLARDPITLTRVEFAHAPTGELAGYQAFFGVTPRFNAPRTAMIMSASVMQTPIQHASAELFSFVKMHLEGLEKALRASKATDALAPLKNAIIAASEHGEFQPKAIARRAEMGYRQAQRLAASYGTTLGALIEEHRFRLARELLDQPKNTVENIALVLGFADDRSFRRAFKRVTGTSPTDYRGGNKRG
ncbi:MAG: AraC family transcriptional regulator ligand-binding domain-containing protein [Pseudomonadota bacterium]